MRMYNFMDLDEVLDININIYIKYVYVILPKLGTL